MYEQEVVTFHTKDPAGADVYHTNVMMAIGTDVAVVCVEAVPDPKERTHLLQRLSRHHKVRPERAWTIVPFGCSMGSSFMRMLRRVECHGEHSCLV